jgi:hypothetical protein
MTSITESSPAPLLKTDTLGRVRTPAARREQLLDEFERSGTSGQTFAQLVGVKYQAFATWVQQRKRRRAATTKRKTPAKVRWLEAIVAQTADHRASLPLPVHLPGGIHLEISSTRQIPLAAALLRALEKSAAAC